MFSREYAEDSYTLDNYIYFIQNQKHQTQKEQEQHIESDNIQKIQYFSERKRKASTQLSLFSWLVKDKPSQHSLLLSLDKELILKIYSYLRISQVFVVSSASSYLFSCYKHLWIDRNFFEKFQTDKFTSEQLNKVIEKSKLDHIKQLKQIYLGKNIRKNREKIKMRVTDENGDKNCLLQIFSISPKIKNGTVFIMDSHLENILNSSYKGLKCIELNRCPYVKNFTAISKCIQLQKFVISYNEQKSLLQRFVTTESLTPIFKRCLKLQRLEISECKNLDENIFKQLKNVEELQWLSLKFFKQSFGNIGLLSECKHLEYLNIDDSLINDDELMNCVREIKSIKNLSIQGCVLLTNISADFLLQRLYKNESHLREILISRIKNIDNQKIQQIQEKLYRMNLEIEPILKQDHSRIHLTQIK